ncbi:hypothetical protein SAMN04488136_1538 [Vibrio xiamenensis]|uniref:Lipoprotein n=1 Tax=Vibrio xiamenensis TaxID=861298 RepID=A0A1G8HID7_9VIBR|nr:hypothetical protein [Vibrio xiamenensis]SDI06467.1 hypothetical protein SAMN04488136_1538 [Vibrio xiamenensis]
MKKTLLAIAVASLSLTGCGGGDGDSSAVTPAATSAVGGVANKGIVNDGLVNVCVASASNVSSKSCAEEDILATTVTNEKGEYTISGLPQNKALLFVLENNPDGQTQMKCDYSGCISDDIEFGDWFDVAEDFKLISLVVPESGNVTAHMTNLTDAAAKRAIEIANGSAEVSAENINAGNAIVAQIFGVDAQNIATIGAIDLTDAEQVNAAINNGESESIKAATISAAIADAGVEVETLWENQSSADGYDDELRVSILSNASQVISSVSEHLEDENLLAEVSASIDTDRETPPQITIPEASDDIQAAKALVEQVRTVYMSAADEEGNLRQGFTMLDESVEPIPALLQDDVSDAFNQLASAFSSIAYHMNTDLFNEQGELEVTADGSTYIIDTDGVKLTVIGTVDVDSSNSEYICDENETDYSYSYDCDGGYQDSANIALQVSNLSVTSGNATITAKSGLVNIENFLDKTQYNDSGESNYNQDTESGAGEYNGEYSSSVTADQLRFVLDDLTITSEDDTQDPITVSGSVEVRVDDLVIVSSDSYADTSVWNNFYDENTGYWGYTDSFEYSSRFDETLTASALVFKVSGDLDYQQQSLDALIDIRINNPSGLVYFSSLSETGTWSYSYDSSSDSYSYGNDDYDITESEGSKPSETEESFLRGSILARISAEVNPQNPQVAEVQLQLSRPALNTINATGHVIYNDEQINISSEYDLASQATPVITISNLSASAMVTEDDKQQVSGQIKVGNVVVANIDAPNGIAIVRYSNGEFESLF